MNDWFVTFTGKRVHVMTPRTEDIDILDIAHALSHLCRFSGMVKRFYCPTQEQRVLTADLRWVAAGDLRVGDELLGFDETPHEAGRSGKNRRRFRHARVLTTVPVKRRIVRLEMEDGATVRASEEHPWLVATKVSRNQVWRTAYDLAADLKMGRVRYMHRFLEPWTATQTWAMGHLAGLYDGEGCLSVLNRGGVQLGIAQNPGLILDSMEKALTALDFDYNRARTGSAPSRVISLQIRGGWREMIRLLGTVRPIRLLDKFVRSLRDGSFDKQMDGIGTPPKIVAAYDEGSEWCAGIETSTHTYICEGFAAHNSVAEHSVRVAQAVMLERPELAKAALLHDAAEAYIGDVISPLKNCLPEYKAIEELWERRVAEYFMMTYEEMNDPFVKFMDLRDLNSARRDLGHENWSKHRWHEDIEKLEPLPEFIFGFPPAGAKIEFMHMYQKIYLGSLGKPV